MSKIKSIFSLFLSLIAILAIAYVLIAYYPIVFSKTIKGKVLKVSKVQDTVAVMGDAQPNSQMFSFAVAIEAEDSIIYTASTEDRQWAAVTEGFCVEAKLFPYPPWNFEKSGTYYNARLLHLKKCDSKVE